MCTGGRRTGRIMREQQGWTMSIESGSAAEAAHTDDFVALLDENFGDGQPLEGAVVKGTVLSIQGDDVLIDIGLKSEGRVPLKEFGVPGQPPEIEPGDVVDVYLERMEDRNGEAVLSRERARREEAWTQLELAYQKSDKVTGTIFGRVKGGFTVDLSGAVAFTEDPEVLDPEVEAVVKRPFVVRLPKRRPKPDPEADPAKEPVPVARPPARPDLLKKPAKPGIRPAPGAWKLPSLQLLTRRAHQPAPAKRALEERRKALEAACLEHGVRGQVDRIQPGPVVTTFEFRLGEGETLKKIRNRHEEICMALRAPAIRVERVKGKGVVGIEVPNASPSVVGLREILESSDFQDETGALPVAIGRLVDGRPLVKDLAEMPHLLIAGATGAGKSVQINTLLCSLLTRRTPDELRLILIDPKRVELRPYRGIPHLLTPLILEPDQAKTVLQHACRELDRRTRILEEHGVRNIDGFNRLVEKMAAREARRRRKKDEPEPEIPSPLPRLVIVVDELADLFIHAKAEVTPAIQRLLSLGRAEGIHLVLATQRPSTDIISGTLKANLPTRIAFRVASYVDSRTILDRVGAEMLLGKGDMLMMRPGADLPRAQGAYVDEREVGKLVRFWESAAEPVFDTGMLEEEQPLPFVGPGNGTAPRANGAARAPKGGDSLLPQARELIIREQKASTSMLQTEMGLGYQRARRIVAELERQGVVGPARGAQPRDVLVAPPS